MPISADATDARCRINLERDGGTLLLGRQSEAPPGQELESGIRSMRVHRKHLRIEGSPPVLTALGSQPCVVISSSERLSLTQGESCVLCEGDEIQLTDKSHGTEFGTPYTGDACAYRVERTGPLLLRPVASDGRTALQLQLAARNQLRLGRTAETGGVTDQRVSRKHALIRAQPSGAPTVTAEGTNPCVLIKALTGEQQRLGTLAARSLPQSGEPGPEPFHVCRCSALAAPQYDLRHRRAGPRRRAAPGGRERRACPGPIARAARQFMRLPR